MNSKRLKKICDSFFALEENSLPVDDVEEAYTKLIEEAFKTVGEKINEKMAHNIAVNFLHELTDLQDANTPETEENYKTALADAIEREIW